MDNNSLSHTRWNCKYHIVFSPKYRRKEIYGKLRNDIGKIIRGLCKKRYKYNRSRMLCGSYTYASRNTTKV